MESVGPYQTTEADREVSDSHRTYAPRFTCFPMLGGVQEELSEQRGPVAHSRAKRDVPAVLREDCVSRR